MISFLTPYWSGRGMMRIHLASIRQFHPAAPILISKRGTDVDEMEAYRKDFGVQYWFEECTYVDALLRLLERCQTEFACILDHDTVLLSSVDPLIDGLVRNNYELVGIEERIREPEQLDWRQIAPHMNGWFRFAPGNMDATFLLFNWQDFRKKWGLRGIRGRRPLDGWHYEYHYGVCQKLKRHKYLLPFHAKKYGMGNLVRDGDVPVLWHQWYGCHLRHGIAERRRIVETGEGAFLNDYPHLDLSELTPAWGPDLDITAEQRTAARHNSSGLKGFITRSWPRVRAWPRHGIRGLASRACNRLDRWRRVL